MLTTLLRVSGVGDGLFVIFFFTLICLTVCCVASKSRVAGWICFGSTSLWIAIFVFIVFVPKDDGSTSSNNNATDHLGAYRIFVTLILAVTFIYSLICFVYYWAFMAIQGHKVRDVYAASRAITGEAVCPTRTLASVIAVVSVILFIVLIIVLLQI